MVCFSVHTSYMLDVTIDRHEPKGSSVKVKKLNRELNLVHHINIKSKMFHKWVSFQKIGFMLCVKCFDQIPSVSCCKSSLGKIKLIWVTVDGILRDSQHDQINVVLVYQSVPLHADGFYLTGLNKDLWCFDDSFSKKASLPVIVLEGMPGIVSASPGQVFPILSFVTFRETADK